MKIRPIKNKTYKNFEDAKKEIWKRREEFPNLIHIYCIRKKTIKIKTYKKKHWKKAQKAKQKNMNPKVRKQYWKFFYFLF